MKFKTINLGMLAMLCFSLASCRDNPELVLKREQQRAEIKRLEGELSLLNEKLKNIPPDRSKELAEAQSKAQAQSDEIAQLEKEVSNLEARKRELSKNFTDYKNKYQLKSN